MRTAFISKAENKLALQSLFSLPRNESTFIFGYMGRFVEQKGVDLIVDILPQLLQEASIQLVMQGVGDRDMERTLAEIAASNPDRVSVHIGYDERYAHLIEAGSDAFLMPSRFEPCGLNQMYSLRYGNVPIAHNTGGLADTVIDATEQALANGTANGLLFNDANPDGLWYAIEKAVHLSRNEPERWRAMILAGMRQDLSWEASARRYQSFYAEALEARWQHTRVASA